MLTVVKEFECFEDGISEILKLLPESIKYIKEVAPEEVVVKNIFEEVCKNFPSISNPEYPAVPAFSISANESGYKAAGFYSVGWKVQRDNENFKYRYSFRITFMSKRPPLKICSDLIENNWKKIVEKKNKK